jgi:hypothetical protein
MPSGFFNERSLSKMVAVFRQPEAAEIARERVKEAAGLDDEHVRLVGPRDASWTRGPASEGSGAPVEAIRPHLTGALAGLSLALVAWSLMYLSDVVVIASTPLPSLVAMALFGTMVGILLGGALAARPDDELMNERVRQATRTGRWALVVQPVSRLQFERALAILQATGAPVARTL